MIILHFHFINTWGTKDLTFDYYWKQLQQPVWRYVCVMDVFIRVAFTWLYNALYLQHFMSFHIHRIEIPHIELFRNGSVHEFYCLKALITLEQVITSVIETKEQS